MNALKKVVFSRTLERVEWQNSRLATTDALDEVAALKQQPGKDLALFGSADLAATLMRANLIDEHRIFVTPVVLGRGRPMFTGVSRRTDFALSRVRQLRSGVVLLSYTPSMRVTSLPA